MQTYKNDTKSENERCKHLHENIASTIVKHDINMICW